ncbi:MAG TPA: hydrogenase 2 operon protein HybA [Thermoanaerobaculia bacterium]|nr:hydrogenase 2 operon protein HybA [Thermoanaerobaculia bacterium]
MAPSTDRRTLLKGLGLAGTAAATGAVPAAAAREPKQAPPRAMGMLYDTTRCIGCKACVVACKDANGMPPDDRVYGDGLYDAPDDLNDRTRNIIKLARDGAGRTSYFKAQCMHCVDPACAASCMLHSLQKDPETGVVSYDPSYCVGCRYCQMSCPFNVIKFEYEKAAPKIVKCELCRHRVGDAALADDGGFSRWPRGHGPACCEVCPRDAVIYGTREELLAEARRRIAAHPGRYFEDRIYGEVEGGGTQVLTLSHLPFAELGLPDLSERGVPHTAYTLQEGLYKGFVAPVVLYAVLAGVMLRNRRQGADEEESR